LAGLRNATAGVGSSWTLCVSAGGRQYNAAVQSQRLRG